MPPRQKWDTRIGFAARMLVIALAASCFSYTLYITLRYANQIPLDIFAFRQTQTALTAYWLGKNGFSLAYETPMVGPPWSIPFELPVYQYIVTLTSEITGGSLNATGRNVSFLFLALCLVPVRAINDSLRLSRSVFYVFAILLFSSPLYLYWGRAFLIETAALFFSITAIKYFIDILVREASFWRSLLFLLFISLSILQKATTGLPVLGILGVIYLIWNIRKANSIEELLSFRPIGLGIMYFGVPLGLGMLWVSYTDQIKALNGLGVSLTSAALTRWNWGDLSQRFSHDLFHDVIWERIFQQNLSGLLGVGLLAVALASATKTSVKLVILTSMVFGLLPLFLFTNLHLIHSYYQVAVVIFLVHALSVAVVQIVENHSYGAVGLVVLCAALAGTNYWWFRHEFMNIVAAQYSSLNSRDYAVAEVLKSEVPQGKVFVAFGNDWDPSLTYLSERKSFTVPLFFKAYELIARNPESFVPEGDLGAVVLCPVAKPTMADLERWAGDRHWKIREVSGCHIALPEKQP